LLPLLDKTDGRMIEEDVAVLMNEFIGNNVAKISYETYDELCSTIHSFYATDEVAEAKANQFLVANTHTVGDMPINVTRKAGEEQALNGHG
jgi:hypothetical protein